MKYEIDYIKRNVSVKDFCAMHGISISKSGFAVCPFHREKTASLKIYSEKSKGFNCYGCGANGTIIDFVMKYYNSSFRDALKIIDSEFHLGLFSPISLTEKRKRIEAENKMKQEHEKEKQAKIEFEKEYDTAFEKWKYYDDNRRRFAPKSPDEEWNPLFVEAINHINYAEYVLNDLELEGAAYGLR